MFCSFFCCCFSFCAHRNTNFQWSEEHDIYLCREILVSQPFNFKIRSPERGRAWEKIANTLNAIHSPRFRVTSRSVRDRCTLLSTKRARKLREIERASGIDVILTELDVLLEEILEREREAKEQIESESAAKKKQIEKDKLTAEDIRKQAMERMAQTAKRKEEEEEGQETVGKNKSKKSRRSTSDVMELIQDKISRESAFRKEEMDFRKKEQEAKEERERIQTEQQERAAQQQQNLLMNMMTQQQQQQQQLQNLQAMFVAQQQQQSQALMALIEKIVKK